MSAFQGYGATKEQVAELFTILSIMRPHGSDTEQKFINTYLAPFRPYVDDCGNLSVRIGTAPVMWSCHVDTVHNFGGIAPVQINDKGIIKRHPKSRANCLGADDGAGIWLMLQMMRAERPGLYVFHRGEERGGIGSKWIAKNKPEFTKGVEAAIAFDRKDKDSIITHQWGGRCCSEDFSASLSKAIGLGMKSDQTGLFTDTASYTDLIGECTNVSVGYHGQHGMSEEQDAFFLMKLMDHMIELDTRDLVYKRKPGEKEARKWGNGYWAGGRGGTTSDVDDYGGYYSDHGGYWTNPKLEYHKDKVWSVHEQGYVYPASSGMEWDAEAKKWLKKKALDEPAKGTRNYMDTNTRWKIARINADKKITAETHLRLVEDYPDQIAALLQDKGFGLGYLHEQIKKKGGKIDTAYLPAEPGGKATEPDPNTQICPTCSKMAVFCQCGKPAEKAIH